MFAIYRKDLKSQYTGMSGWIVSGFTLFILGLYFTVYCVYGGYSAFSSVLSNSLFIFLAFVPLLCRGAADIRHKNRYEYQSALQSLR